MDVFLVGMFRKGSIMKTIKMQLIVVIVGVSLLTTTLIGGIFIYNMIKTSDEGLANYQTELRANVEHQLKMEVQTAVAVAEGYYKKQQAGELTPDQARKEAADRIRDMRYDDGNGYFAVDTYDGVNVVLLGRDTEGKSRINSVDPNGKHFIQEMIVNGKKDGGGYTELMFAKPNTTEPLPKLNYSVAFAPYQWIIETGVWIDYIDAQIAQKKAAQDEALHSAIIRAIINMVVLEILFVILGIYIGKKMGQPIQLMAQRVHTLSTGDFRQVESAEIAACMDRQDEIGQISRAVRDLRANISKLMITIVESAEYVASASEELTASSDQSATVSGQVANSVVNVAGSCGEQFNAVNHADERVKDLSSNMQQFQTAIEAAHKKIESTNEAAMLGSNDVSQAVEQMRAIESSVGEASRVITGLGEESKQIGTIVDTISEIAAQTNLLALNAAIEAARAGEHGRGFAVVADEVRKLAEQSQVAASQIAELIASIQQSADRAVASMQSGNEQVQSGTSMVTNAGSTFRDIVGMVTEVADSSNLMGKTVDNLTDGAEQIAQAVKTIDDMSRKVSSEAENVSAATEQQSATMQEIANASRALAENAQKLQAATAKFQI